MWKTVAERHITEQVAPRVQVTGTGTSTARKLQVRKYETWHELQRVCPAWNQLLAESSSPSIFLSWEWLQSWWDAFGDAHELLLLVCCESDGSVVAIAPLYRTRRQGRLGAALRVLRIVGDGSGDSDNLDLIVRKGYEVAAVQALLDWLAQRSSDWDIMELNTVPSESLVANALVEELVRRRWNHGERVGPHLVLPLPDRWETYLDSLSTNMRSSVTSRIRRLKKRYNVRLRRCQTEAELPQCLDELFRLHSKRWELRAEPGSFSLPQRRLFYRKMAKQFLAQGWLDFWMLDVNDQVVATEFGFRYGDTYSFLQGGFDPEYYSHSIGVVLRGLLLEELIRDGVSWYDFLGGVENHKQRWGAQLRSYHYLACAQPWSRGALHLAGVQIAERSKAWLRTRMPAPALTLLRGMYHRLVAQPHVVGTDQPAVPEVKENCVSQGAQPDGARVR